MSNLSPLDPQSLLRRCDAALLDFETTAELSDAADIVGQSRALDAVRFGIDIKQPGFNLFVLGEPGSGRHAAVRRLLEEKAASEPAPSDWCYVNNFADPNKPRLLRLPPGRGGRFRHDMQQFVAELGKAIGAAFESEEYRVRIEAIQDEFKQREENALRTLGQESGEKGVALLRTPHGFVFAPVKGEETMGPEEFEKLPDEEKARIGKLIEEYGERLHKLMHQFPQWRREMQGRIKEASRETMGFAVGHIIEELKERYTDLLNVLAFLDEAMRDVIESSEQLREQPKSDGDMSGVLVSGSISLARYQVNLLVDTRHGQGGAGGLRGQPDLSQPGRPRRQRRPHGHAGDQLHPDQARRPAARQRRLPGAGCRQGAEPALRLGGPQARAALGPGAHRVARPGVRLHQHAAAGAGADAAQPQGGAGRRAHPLLPAQGIRSRSSRSCSRSARISRATSRATSRQPAATPASSPPWRAITGCGPLDRLAVARVIEHSARLAGDAERSPPAAGALPT
jgi:hypothetical protein